MAIYPKAVVELLPENATQPHIVPTCVVLHSNAGASRDLYGWWQNPGSCGLESHFQVALDGTVFQYMDTTVHADANVQANAYGISIETENHPNTAFSADPWSAEQKAALIALIGWCCDTHGIPKVLCADGRHGVGWHDQYPQWTTPHHVCPGRTRVGELQTVIIPALTTPPAPKEDELTPDQQKQLADTYAMQNVLYVDRLYRDLLGRPPDTAGLEYWVTRLRDTNPLAVYAAIKESHEAQGGDK